MKKFFTIVLTFILSAPLLPFAEWSPAPLEITVDPYIEYYYNEEEIDITVDVSGKPCKAYLWINTRLAEDQMPVDLRNGNLGWHYVNRIDTTVYISGTYDFDIGTGHKITWDGIGSESTSSGTTEPSEVVKNGNYDYYVFAYDDTNPRERVCNFVCISYYWNPQYVRIGEYYNDGSPRTQPLLMGNTNIFSQDLHALKDSSGNVTGPAEGWNSYGPPLNTAFKFPIGSDPDDISSMQTTVMPGITGPSGVKMSVSPVIFDPVDESVFFSFHEDIAQKKGTLFRWNWNEGGSAEIDDYWGGWDDINIPTASESLNDRYGVAAATDGGYINIASPGSYTENKLDRVYLVDFDGELLSDQQLDDFFTPVQPNSEYSYGRVNRMFANPYFPEQAIVSGEASCITMMINTDRFVLGYSNYIKWSNGNGDFFLDSGWDINTASPENLWQCNIGDSETSNMILRNESWFDRNGIVVQNSDYLGQISFVVYTQDGSGVAYCKFADDVTSFTTPSDPRKGSSQRCDTGSQYDGIYLGGVVTPTSGYGPDTQSINWIASDSASGIISFEGNPHHVAGTGAPWGSSHCKVNKSNIFYSNTGNCGLGHECELSFIWNDEIQTEWSSNTSISHIFTSPGIHTLKVRARCAVDTTVVSSISQPFLVNVGAHYFPEVVDTGNYMRIYITIDNVPQINNEPIDYGDCIGVFTPEGICAGSVFWDRDKLSGYIGNIKIFVWGNDPEEPGVLGFETGDPLTFKIWDLSEETEYNVTFTFTDENTTYLNGKYLTLDSVTVDSVSGIEQSVPNMQFSLSQNAPNPFNPSTTIEYEIPGTKSVRASLKIYDLRGALVRTLVNEISNPGNHSVVWDGKDNSGNSVSSGIYIYSLHTGDSVLSHKMTLLR